LKRVQFLGRRRLQPALEIEVVRCLNPDDFDPFFHVCILSQIGFPDALMTLAVKAPRTARRLDNVPNPCFYELDAEA